jgi:hypothetical protein
MQLELFKNADPPGGRGVASGSHSAATGSGKGERTTLTYPRYPPLAAASLPRIALPVPDNIRIIRPALVKDNGHLHHAVAGPDLEPPLDKQKLLEGASAALEDHDVASDDDGHVCNP